jgi:hypothetical protein
MSDKDTKSETKQRKPRTRRHYMLVEVTEDQNTQQPVFAIIETPPLDGAAPTPRRIIDAARKAVYEDGQKQFGNKKLVGTFDVPFIERMALTPPA